MGKEGEGRPVYNPEAIEKIDAARRKYSKSQKRKDAQDRYEDSKKGQATTERYLQSEKHKLTQQKYYYSKKGQEAHKRNRNRNRTFRDAQKWLEEHPGKTLKDYLSRSA